MKSPKLKEQPFQNDDDDSSSKEEKTDKMRGVCFFLNIFFIFQKRRGVTNLCYTNGSCCRLSARYFYPSNLNGSTASYSNDFLM